MKKHSKRGFTLIELLVSIVILGIMTAVALPGVKALIESNNRKKFKTYEKSLVESAKLYTSNYSEDMFGNNQSGCYKIPIANMIDKGLVKDIKINDITCNNTSTFIMVKKIQDKYEYKVAIKCLKDAN